jgi:hypothetical protein
MMGKNTTIPFDFVLEEISRLEPRVRPMFGCHAIYIGEKIVLIVRKKAEGDPDNGVWITTAPEHHESLKKMFPAMRSIKLFGEKTSSWQILPEDADDFEESAMKACALILKNDPRIGKIPKKKSTGKAKKAPKKKRSR